MSSHFNRKGILETSLRCHLFPRRFPVRASARTRSDHTENKSPRPRRQISRPDKCCKLSQKQKKKATQRDGGHGFFPLRPLPLPRSRTKRKAYPPCLFVQKIQNAVSRAAKMSRTLHPPYQNLFLLASASQTCWKIPPFHCMKMPSSVQEMADTPTVN